MIYNNNNKSKKKVRYKNFNDFLITIEIVYNIKQGFLKGNITITCDYLNKSFNFFFIYWIWISEYIINSLSNINKYLHYVELFCYIII